ncbi:MAG: hypothetical protein Q9210_002825 [Variospora velana]
MPGGPVTGGTPVPVGPAAPVPPLGVTTTLAPGIGYGAIAVETITDGSAAVDGAGAALALGIDDSIVDETTGEETTTSGNDDTAAALVSGVDDSTVGETTGEESTTSGNDDTTAALEVLDVEGVISAGMVSAGGVDSPSARVEVTVAFPKVLVSVMVEVEDMVVVGSVSGAPASRAASDRRGRARRAEVSERRMVVVEAQTADTQIVKMNQKSSISPTVDFEKNL